MKLVWKARDALSWAFTRLGCLVLGHNYAYVVRTGDGRSGRGCLFCDKFEEGRDSRRKRR